MEAFIAFTLVGLVTGAGYAIAASGLVITYATSNVFNVAHGAVGMLMAFVFWELDVNRGLPAVLALLLTVLVIAPLFGALLDRTMMRRLTDAPVAASLTVTVGLLVALVGLAQAIWPPTARPVTEFFATSSVSVADVTIAGRQILTFVIALIVAGTMYYLLKETRTGIGMRAVVDNRMLLALHGGRPERLGMFSWALGSSLAALAGILLAPALQLDYLVLTLLVINAYAAAMVGKLKNLPRTFVGAMALGVLESYFLLLSRGQPHPLVTVGVMALIAVVVWRGWVAWWAGLVGAGIFGLVLFVSELPNSLQSSFKAAAPALFLFGAMLLLPQERLRVGTVRGASLVKVPSWPKAVTWGLILLVGVVVLTQIFSTSVTGQLGIALAYALIMLSLVVLTGYGGDVSLGQMTFVGFGALVVARVPWFGAEVSIWSVLAGTLVAAAAGALIALPALRLRGLYLGLGTLAFARAMDKLVFENSSIGFSFGGNQEITRPGLFASEGAFTILVAVAFVLTGWFVLWLRKGRYGRFLLATRDSPAACATLGLNITKTRVMVFAISAGMAGLAGGLFAGMRVAIGSSDFLMFRSLPLLLLAVVGGITSVTGALIGGLALGLSPALQDAFPTLGGIVNLAIGAVAISLGRNPNGIAGMLFKVRRRATAGTPTGGAPDRTDERRDETDVVLEEVSAGAPA